MEGLRAGAALSRDNGDAVNGGLLKRVTERVTNIGVHHVLFAVVAARSSVDAAAAGYFGSSVAAVDAAGLVDAHLIIVNPLDSLGNVVVVSGSVVEVAEVDDEGNTEHKDEDHEGSHNNPKDDKDGLVLLLDAEATHHTNDEDDGTKNDATVGSHGVDVLEDILVLNVGVDAVGKNGKANERKQGVKKHQVAVRGRSTAAHGAYQ
mmetsp:Transcript_13626/g.26314  ORF Transcript_13626/g.26314 Transcript_13626/m.26314 type:complete len:205 (-) Transcript_13626:35-649(-)